MSWFKKEKKEERPIEINYPFKVNDKSALHLLLEIVFQKQLTKFKYYTTLLLAGFTVFFGFIFLALCDNEFITAIYNIVAFFLLVWSLLNGDGSSFSFALTKLLKTPLDKDINTIPFTIKTEPQYRLDKRHFWLKPHVFWSDYLQKFKDTSPSRVTLRFTELAEGKPSTIERLNIYNYRWFLGLQKIRHRFGSHLKVTLPKWKAKELIRETTYIMTLQEQKARLLAKCVSVLWAIKWLIIIILCIVFFVLFCRALLYIAKGWVYVTQEKSQGKEMPRELQVLELYPDSEKTAKVSNYSRLLASIHIYGILFYSSLLLSIFLFYETYLIYGVFQLQKKIQDTTMEVLASLFKSQHVYFEHIPKTIDAYVFFLKDQQVIDTSPSMLAAQWVYLGIMGLVCFYGVYVIYGPLLKPSTVFVWGFIKNFFSGGDRPPEGGPTEGGSSDVASDLATRGGPTEASKLLWGWFKEKKKEFSWYDDKGELRVKSIVVKPTAPEEIPQYIDPVTGKNTSPLEICFRFVEAHIFEFYGKLLASLTAIDIPKEKVEQVISASNLLLENIRELFKKKN